MSIDTAHFSEALRGKSIDLAGKRLLVTNFDRAGEGASLESINCGGYGRVRDFKRATELGWPPNPLPIDPAARKLGMPRVDVMAAQVFQNASCNWRCWYCYVPFNLLAANEERSGWMSASELVDLFERERNPAKILDLSGGQPDLTPEWVVWMMHELKERGLDKKVYLWSDDNLSNDYFWRYLSKADILTLKKYPSYGKVCCFKGFNRESFAFNTMAAAELFDNQLTLFERYLTLNIDLYAYVTLTTPTEKGMERDMSDFLDRLQALAVDLPLRVVPLEIRTFPGVHERVHTAQASALELQWLAIKYWLNELERRYTPEKRAAPICEISLY